MTDSLVTGSKKTYFDGYDFEPFEEGSSLIWSDSTNPNTFSDSRERINGVPPTRIVTDNNPTTIEQLKQVAQDLKSKPGSYFQEMINVDPDTLKVVSKPTENYQEYSGVTIGTDKIRDRINGVPYKEPEPKKEFFEPFVKEAEKYIEQNKINYEEREITQEPKRFFDESDIKEIEKYIEQNRINYEQHSFPTLEYSSAEEMNNIREFVDGIDLLIKDIAVLNNDSYEIRGSFGQAMAYSSDVCKDNMASLKRFAEENMTPALKQVGEYEANDVEIKRIIKPLVGDISKVKFMSDGTISVPNLNSPTDKYTVAKAEEFYKRNRNIKEKLEALSNDRINKAS